MNSSEQKTCRASHWKPTGSGVSEHFVAIRPPKLPHFLDEIERAFSEYRRCLIEAQIEEESVAACTFFLSDSANQEELLRSATAFTNLSALGCAISIVEQPPANAKIAFLAHHIASPSPKTTLSRSRGPSSFCIDVNGYRLIYLKNILPIRTKGITRQSKDLFSLTNDVAMEYKISWHNIIRTWLYVDNIDANYGTLNKIRNVVFDSERVGGEMGFPASTAIGGRTRHASNSVTMDILSIQGLAPGQNRRMQASTRMNSTQEYGVRFERGREVAFGNRRNFYISGTASIDSKGSIVHLGDVAAQTSYALKNIEALLAASDATVAAIKYLIVYVRDFNDFQLVEKIVDAPPFGSTPYIIVRAAVCRPGWLVEIECFGIDNKGDPRFAEF